VNHAGEQSAPRRPTWGGVSGIIGIDRRTLPALLALVAALLILGWFNRFIQDDAFISFRYAQNLASGAGLVWNPGEPVEGYTNFLWTVLIAAGMQAGLGPVLLTEVLGICFFACSLLLTFGVARAAGFTVPDSFAALLLTGTNYTFSCYATGGLETQMVTALFLAGCLAALGGVNGHLQRRRALLTIALLAIIAVLCRMDSALLLWGTGAGLMLLGPRRGDGAACAGAGRSSGWWPEFCILVIFPVLMLAPWCVWKLWYYGDLLPHSFYLKAVNASTIEHGLRYFYAFIVSYDLYPFLFVCVFFAGRLFLKEQRPLLLLAGVVTLWFLYILKIGGDFMEFRFMVQVIPLMMVLLVWALGTCARGRIIRAAGILLVLGGSVHHALTFSYEQETGVEPVAMLAGHLTAEGENWVGIGRALGSAFAPSDSVTIATTAAGAIPYYSGLRTVDMLGINSRGGADRGVFVGYIPGHQRILPYSALNEMGVNLVISHPIVSRSGTDPRQLPLVPTDGPPHLRARLIRIPIGGGWDVSVLYIRENAAVDSAIARFGWPQRTVSF